MGDTITTKSNKTNQTNKQNPNQLSEQGVPSFAKVLLGPLGTLLNAFGQTLGESRTKPACSNSFLTPFMFCQATSSPSCYLTRSPGKCLMHCLFLQAACLCETELSLVFHVQHSSPFPSPQWTYARAPLPFSSRLLPCSVFNNLLNSGGR